MKKENWKISIEKRIGESIKTKELLLRDAETIEMIWGAAKAIRESFAKGGKILLCGNGGSASDALHIAGELTGRFQKERRALPAVALNADMASITAVANDYGYGMVFSRAVEGLMNPEDVLLGISTSGNSEKVYRAVKKAKELGAVTAALLGNDGGKIKSAVDYGIIVPGSSTARIQESHIMIGHIICELVEAD